MAQQPRPSQRNTPKRKVEEKFLKRRRLFLVAVGLLLLVIIISILLLKKPKDTLPEGDSPSSGSSQDVDGGASGSDSSPASTPAARTVVNPEGDAISPEGRTLRTLSADLEEKSIDKDEDSYYKTAGKEEPMANPLFLQISADVPDVSPNATLNYSAIFPLEEDWRLLVVSKNTLLPAEFVIKTLDAGMIPVDERIQQPLVRMIMDAKEDGINLQIMSGYRSEEKQQELYDSKIQEYLASGLSRENAEAYTKMYISLPGESEHHTGLAVDIMTPTNTTMDYRFADTIAAKWLLEHAADYGFILRYPEGKEKITGISFEPWHYRYVSTPIAQEIMERNITLEEYLYIRQKAAEPSEISLNEKAEELASDTQSTQ